jgi:peptidoglycan-associated lipoprotein
MKIVLKQSALSALFVLAVFASTAQKDFLVEADGFYKGGQLRSAIDAYQRAYPKAKTAEEKGYIKFQLGECHRMAASAPKAEEFYKAAVDLKYSDNRLYCRYADVQHQQGKYEEALANYKKCNGAEAKLGIESCTKSMELKKATTRYVVQEEAVLNTEHYDMTPIFGDRQGKTMYFTSNRPGSTGPNINQKKFGSNGDIWTTSKDAKGHWGQPAIVPGLNSDVDEGAAVFDSRFSTIYFTRCPEDPKGKKGFGCEICMTEKKGKGWDDIVVLPLKPEDGGDTMTVGHPALAPDDSYMVFASDMPGGQGGKDLWISKYDKREKKWMTPTNLGAGINTPGDELFPYIHPTTGALFFSSNGHPGMGGIDIFKAEKSGDAAWGKPENMGTPLNSPAHDYGIIFEGTDYTRGFFTSNRKGNNTKDDIYSFNMPPLNFDLTCIVLDKDSKEPIRGAKIKLLGTNNTSIEVETDENGQFFFEKNAAGERYIAQSVNYNIEVSKIGEYLNAKDAFTTMNLTESTKFYKEFLVQSVIKEIRVPEVRYDFDSDVLQVNDSVNSKDSLNFVYDVLTENPTIVIKLKSHTDCRGNDKYNEDLAQRRAQACVNYLLTEKGIPADRIVPVGRGEYEPLKGLECDAIEKLPTKAEREGAHQRNRRTNIEIISWDYVPKEQ